MGNDSTAWRIVPTGAFGGLMLTSKEYLQRAEECSQLANASSDVYVREALTELASDFKSIAKALEQREHHGWMENATASRYCRADVKWINGYALRPHHKLSKAHQYPA